MQFAVRHVTTYRYTAPVHLGPHILRLTPRSDGRQRLLEHARVHAARSAVCTLPAINQGHTMGPAWL
jgi:transglutaminase-like putative cysteine protease